MIDHTYPMYGLSPVESLEFKTQTCRFGVSFYVQFCALKTLVGGQELVRRIRTSWFLRRESQTHHSKKIITCNEAICVQRDTENNKMSTIVVLTV